MCLSWEDWNHVSLLLILWGKIQKTSNDSSIEEYGQHMVKVQLLHDRCWWCHWYEFMKIWFCNSWGHLLLFFTCGGDTCETSRRFSKLRHKTVSHGRQYIILYLIWLRHLCYCALDIRFILLWKILHNMYPRMHTCLCVYTCVYIGVSVNIRRYIHMCTRIDICICIRTCLCRGFCVFVISFAIVSLSHYILYSKL